MRLLIVTDAWFPQVNGVVRTLSTMVEQLRARGDIVETVTPADFRSTPCPTYPEIRLAVCSPRAMARRIEAFQPTAVHIATEGPLGFLARRYVRKRGWPFSTSFHTRFPEYIHARTRFPVRWSYAGLRWFHGAAASVMVPTAAVQQDLAARGFRNLKLWTRGVDTALFRPGPRPGWADGLPRPVMLYVGRVAVEKSLPDFLGLARSGTKLVVGDGPARAALARQFPEGLFLGAKFGERLAEVYRAADVFVFPSRTDTFGLVMLEALASGVPVAACPVMGPIDVIGKAPVGCLDHDLDRAIGAALQIPRDACRSHAEGFSWLACAERFRGFLVPFG